MSQSGSRKSPIVRGASSKAKIASTSRAVHEEMIPVMYPDGRWELVPGGPGSGDIFENPFANFTEWDSEEDRKAFAHL